MENAVHLGQKYSSGSFKFFMKFTRISFSIYHSQAQSDWKVASATLNSPRRRRSRPATATSRLRGLDTVDSGSAKERPALVKTSTLTDWLRLLEKLGDTQFGEVRDIFSYAITKTKTENRISKCQKTSS